MANADRDASKSNKTTAEPVKRKNKEAAPVVATPLANTPDVTEEEKNNPVSTDPFKSHSNALVEPMEQKNTTTPTRVSILSLSTIKVRKKHRNIGTLRQWGVSLVITFSFFIVGMSLGWPSPVLYRMRETGEPLNLTTIEASVMVTLFYAGNILMPIPGGVLADIVGRKTSLLIMSILPLSSWVLIYFAIHPAMLFVARLFAGMWSGMSQTIVPIYIGEIVESKNRGKISSLSQLYINTGIILVYFIGRVVSYWTLAIVSGVMPVLFFLVMMFMPESPYWLFYTGSSDKAEKSLSWLRGGNAQTASRADSVLEAEEFNIARAVRSDMHKPQGWQMLFKVKGYRFALMIVQVLSVFQRLSGISAVMAYASLTLPDQPVWEFTPNDCVTIIGVSWFLGCAASLALVDKVGRIPLLLTSSLGSALGMLTALVWFFIHRSTTEYSVHWLPFLALFWYGLWFNVGLGPLPTTIQGEMFPSHLKAAASAITAMVLAATSVIVNSSYLFIARSVGMYVNYAVFTLTCVACFIFTWFCVIETKGKTLNEIQQDLKTIH